MEIDVERGSHPCYNRGPLQELHEQTVSVVLRCVLFVFMQYVQCNCSFFFLFFLLLQVPQQEAGTRPFEVFPHSPLSPWRKSKGKHSNHTLSLFTKCPTT